METQEKWITPQEFAAMARVHLRTVYRWERESIGPAPVRPEGTRVLRYRLADVEAFLEGVS